MARKNEEYKIYHKFWNEDKVYTTEEFIEELLRRKTEKEEAERK